MTAGDADRDGEPQRPDAEHRLSVPAVLIAYGVMAALAWGWLRLRERGGLIGRQALGDSGPALALAVGLGVGAALYLGMVLAARYLAPMRTLEAELRRLLGGPSALGEAGMLTVAMTSALAEELFFRCALLDAIGPYWSALIFGLLHSGGVRGAWLWGLLAFAVALLFGWMVGAGLGLLSVTVAHAVTNYLSLRRLLT